MRLEPPTPSAVRAVALAMRDDDAREFLALSHCKTRLDLAEALVARFGDNLNAIVARDSRGVPVAVGGLFAVRPNVLTALFFATPGIRRIGLPLTRYVMRKLLPRAKAEGAHRIEAVSWVGHETAHRWIRCLGMSPEGLPMQGYGKNGESFQQFAWVSDACSPGAGE